MKEKEIDFLDILIVLATHKKFIFFTVLIVSIAAVIYSFLAPQYWISTATILPAQSDSRSLPLSSSLLGFGSGILGESFQTQGIDLVTVMNSRTFSQKVIEKFNLIEYFKLKGDDKLKLMDQTLELLQGRVASIGFNEENGLVYISIETKDKYLSTDIANYYWQELERYNQKTRTSTGRQKRIFIEGRIAEVKHEIDSLAILLKEFQEGHYIIDLESQISAVIDLYSGIVAQKLQKDIELDFLVKQRKEDTPQYQEVLDKKLVLEDRIREIESANEGLNIKYGLQLDRVPDISLQYAQLLLEAGIQKNLYEFLYPQYEEAKIEEIKDLPTIEIIDKAVPAGLRSKPRRAIFCIVAFFSALILTSILVLIYHALSHKSGKINRFVEVLKTK